MPDRYVGRIKEKDLKLKGKVGIELSHCNFPFRGLLLQAIQFSMSGSCVGLRGDEQILCLLKLAHALLLLLQKLGDPALQLVSLSLVGGIPVVQLLGHVHRGYAVLMACLQCSFLICRKFEVKEKLKIENSNKS
jgi:hypothetical protein